MIKSPLLNLVVLRVNFGQSRVKFFTFHHMEKVLYCLLVQTQGFLIVFCLVLLWCLVCQVNGFLYGKKTQLWQKKGVCPSYHSTLLCKMLFSVIGWIVLSDKHGENCDVNFKEHLHIHLNLYSLINLLHNELSILLRRSWICIYQQTVRHKFITPAKMYHPFMTRQFKLVCFLVYSYSENSLPVLNIKNYIA